MLSYFGAQTLAGVDDWDQRLETASCMAHVMIFSCAAGSHGSPLIGCRFTAPASSNVGAVAVKNLCSQVLRMAQRR